MTIRNLQHLLEPESVALIGASAEQNSVGNWLCRNLLGAGFKGRIDFVNPRRPEILGHKAVGSIGELPSAPSLAVIVTPAATVPGIIAELGARGTRAAIVITAGIRAELRQAMLDAAKPHCLRILGPNVIGLVVPGIGLNASFSHIAAPAGDLAFLSQSGALVTGILDWAASRNIGFSHVVSLGDMADVDFGDMLDYLAGDIRSRAILLYMEAVTSVPKFMSAARRAARIKPVIVVKSGRHAEGARAAASHTGALAGSDAAYDAAFRRAGLLRVVELEDLFNAAEMLSRNARMDGERLTILTNGGGAGVLAADRVIDFHGRLARLSEPTIKLLDEALPATWSHANPVDIIGDADAGRYRKALEILLQDASCDAVLVLHCPVAVTSSLAAAQSVVDAHKAFGKQRDRGKKPVLASWLGDRTVEQARHLFAENDIPSFETPENAVEGFMQLAMYRRAQEELLQVPPSLGAGLKVDRAAADAIIQRVVDTGRRMLSEDEAKAMLVAYDIPTVATVVAETAEAVAEAVRRIASNGDQAVIKILSDDISHKSDVGGVRLGIANAREAFEVASEMLARVRALKPEARLRGFTVQQMIRRKAAHELIIGMSVDQTFGPLLMFGAGGTAVEVLRDTSVALPPLDLKLAHEMMMRTDICRRLHGYRDQPPAKMEEIALTLVKVGQLIADHPQVRELDINPLLADAQGVIALDARVLVESETANPRKPFALRPYPVEWERSHRLKDGRAVQLRPIRPDDAALYAAFFRKVTPEDSRMRFFSPLRSVSNRQLMALTQIDYAREIAFVAIDEAGKLLGVARFFADPDYTSAEYGILVRSDLKGQGLGRRLMDHLIEYARSEGLSQLHGIVLAENDTMLSMCQTLGFKVSVPADDPTLRTVTLQLTKGV